MGGWGGLYCLRLKVPTAPYYVIAWSFFLVGTIIKALTVLGFLPAVFITDYAQQIGSSIEVILLSLGLADRINQLKRDSRDKQERYLQLKLKSTEEENASRQAMLETQVESNKLKDAFLTTISHELRTPMNGVFGAIELIRTHDLNKKLRENVEIAEVSAERMISLVDRVLDFSQTQKAIREGGSPNKHIPIIAVTANVTDQDKKKAFQCGMNDLVAKPVNLKLIQASIETWLAQRTKY